MCKITKAVKGGMNLQEAEKLINEKIEEMCVCDTEDEGESSFVEGPKPTGKIHPNFLLLPS